MKNNSKEKKYTFNEAIDNSINNLSVSLTFILIGVLLYFEILKFGNELTSNVIQWCFIIFGVLMIFTGLGKTGDDNPYKIKGFDSLSIGFIFIIIWYFFRNFTFFPFIILSVLILIVGVYGFIRGILEILYSLKLKFTKLKKESILKFTSELILFLAKISSLILTILNILKALNIIK